MTSEINSGTARAPEPSSSLEVGELVEKAARGFDYDPGDMADWIGRAADLLAAQQREIEGLRACWETCQAVLRETEADREQLHLAICGGEDAPGYAFSIPTAQVIEVFHENRRSAEAQLAAATARADKLELALDAVVEWDSVCGDALPNSLAKQIREALTTNQEGGKCLG